MWYNGVSGRVGGCTLKGRWNMAKLKKGAIVKVYEDPLTRKKFEGYAKLLGHWNTLDRDGLEYWECVFEGDYEPEVGRLVHPEDDTGYNDFPDRTALADIFPKP
jgi:hypothetical protein